jgi:hypothetical protein
MGNAAAAVYLSGRWSELEWVREAQALMWEEAQQVPGLSYQVLWMGTLPMLATALAREDRAAADAAAALLERALNPSHPHTPGRRSGIAAYLADDPARLDLEALAHLPAYLAWDLVIWSFSPSAASLRRRGSSSGHGMWGVSTPPCSPSSPKR